MMWTTHGIGDKMSKLRLNSSNSIKTYDILHTTLLTLLWIQLKNIPYFWIVFANMTQCDPKTSISKACYSYLHLRTYIHIYLWPTSLIWNNKKLNALNTSIRPFSHPSIIDQNFFQSLPKLSLKIHFRTQISLSVRPSVCHQWNKISYADTYMPI